MLDIWRHRISIAVVHSYFASASNANGVSHIVDERIESLAASRTGNDGVVPLRIWYNLVLAPTHWGGNSNGDVVDKGYG